MITSSSSSFLYQFSWSKSRHDGCSSSLKFHPWRKSPFGSLFLVQFLAAAKELDYECLCDGLIMRSCCLMLENQVFYGSEVVVVAAGKRGFPAMKFMTFDVFLMCI
ncbi:uncharacterized protein DS421_15g503360 [Arachis hypogaea]|nr:uncharacterized protein DS421_15g503360 [Arachis hypogaea]